MPQEDLRVRIREIGKLTPSALAVVMERPDGFEYKPGQHIYLELEADRGKPFSLVSAPHEDTLEIATIIRDRSDFKRDLAAKQPGDELIVSGPYGRFAWEEGEDPVLFLTGGIGITPFVGILRHLAANAPHVRGALLYANKTRSQIAYKEELDALSEKLPGFTVVNTLTREEWEGETGRIDAGMIRKYAGDVNGHTGYIAGPPALLKDLSAILKKDLGVEQLKADGFSGY